MVDGCVADVVFGECGVVEVCEGGSELWCAVFAEYECCVGVGYVEHGGDLSVLVGPVCLLEAV